MTSMNITPIHFWIAFGIVRLASVKPSCSPGSSSRRMFAKDPNH